MEPEITDIFDRIMNWKLHYLMHSVKMTPLNSHLPIR